MFRSTIFQEKKIRSAFVSVLVLNIAVALIYSLVFIKIQQKNDRNRALVTTMAELAAQKETLQSIQKNISETGTLRAQIDGYFVSSEGVVEFLNLLHTISLENGLISKVVSVGVEPSEPVSDIV